MLVFLAFCSALAVHSYAETSEHFLKPNDELKLWPTTEEGRSRTSWTISSAKGAKIIASCIILSRSCYDHTLTINNGVATTLHCGNERFVLKSSDDDKMQIHIDTIGFRKGSYCKVKATKPFLHQEFEKRDSSEDGQKDGNKKPSCKCGWTNKPMNRIVGGSEAKPNEYPWAVLLGIRRTNYQFCGGSIIAPKYVLTAAHCTYPFKLIPLAVYVGEHDTRTTSKNPHAEKVNVLVAHDHPSYNDKTNVGDISVLELIRPITFSQNVGPVCLPNPQEMPNIHDEFIKVMGWGHMKTNGTASPVLKKVDIRVIDLDICSSVYSNVDTENPTQICTWAPNRDSCQGDSGGPLVWNDPNTNRLTQVAVVSYGRDCASTDPGVNTNVYAYMDWINNIVKGTSSRKDPSFCTI